MGVQSKSLFVHLKQLENVYNDFHKNHQVLPPQPTLERLSKRKKTSEIDRGHERADRIRGLLDKFPRSELQIKMHERMLNCANRLIYEDAVKSFPLEIMSYNEFTDLEISSVITASRRFGKTWATAIFAICVLMVLPKIEVSIFSTNKRASGDKTGMMGVVRDLMFEQFEIAPEQIIHMTPETMHIRFGENDVRKINAYPGSVDT
jgi:hypothetical protein